MINSIRSVKAQKGNTLYGYSFGLDSFCNCKDILNYFFILMLFLVTVEVDDEDPETFFEVLYLEEDESLILWETLEVKPGRRGIVMGKRPSAITN